MIKLTNGKFYEKIEHEDNAMFIANLFDEAKKEFPKIRHVEEDDIIFDYYVDGEITAWKEKWFGDV